jgi:hypothetical protein
VSTEWGTTRASVTVWCGLPISWRGKRAGFRRPPKLKAGDAIEILVPLSFLPGNTFDDLSDLAIDLDDALSELASARDDGDREYITDARDTAESCLDGWYSALRKALHPEKVAAEEAGLEAMCAAPLTGLGE